MPDLSLIPFPAQVKIQTGQWILSSESEIKAPASLAGEVDYLANKLRRATGFPLVIKATNSTKVEISDIRIELDPKLSSVGREGYRLIVGAQGVELRAIANAGIFYGIQTLLQLFPPAIYGAGPRNHLVWSAPHVEIEDSPRFPWRGAMLDCSRHFKPVEFIRKFIDAMALHKLNTFHWHLTDDQGWRIEIKKYPRLTEVGAWRSGTWRGHDECASTDDGIPHGGFYTQDQIRDLVRYAAERHITIVPEIEMPGHAQAALAAYLGFGCTEEKIEVRTRWGISEHIYSPTENTFHFLEDILGEVLELFPGTFIHIGGDEAIKKQWDTSPHLQDWLAMSGAKDSHELQSYFIRHFDRFLAAKGRRLIGWDEILEGGLAEGASVMSWRGIEGGITAANKGHDVVMTPTSHTYLDAYQSQEIAQEPLAIGSYLPLEKAYAYDPVPAGLPAEKIRHILGVQGQLWGEYMPTTDHTEYMAFPRLAALADVGWTSRPRRPYAAFQEGLEIHLKRLDMLGIKYRPPTGF